MVGRRGLEWSVDAGDGGEDGEDEDGRGGGRRKRTQNVMGNIRNYDIDQLDAQAKNRRNSNSTFPLFSPHSLTI